MAKKNKTKKSRFDPSEVFVYRGQGRVPRNVRRVEVHRSVKFIPDNLFEGCHQLESVLLHEGLLGIGWCAFSRCSSLRSIQIPSTVTEIGAYAFYGCSNLAAVELPEGLESIEEWTFAWCLSLEEMRIPRDGLRMIGVSAFDGCRSLESLRSIPSSVETIGEYAFDHCSSLALVQLNDDLSMMKRYVFRGCPAESFRFARLSERMEAMRMDDRMTSMFESRLNEITNAMTRHYDDWRVADDIWEKCRKSLERAHDVLNYLELKGAMPVLELALWKAKIDDEQKERLQRDLANNEDEWQGARDAGRVRQQGPHLSREDCRVKCGAGIVTAEVRKFFAYSTAWPGLEGPE